MFFMKQNSPINQTAQENTPNNEHTGSRDTNNYHVSNCEKKTHKYATFPTSVVV